MSYLRRWSDDIFLDWKSQRAVSCNEQKLHTTWTEKGDASKKALQPADFPTDPFTILEPQNKGMGTFYVINERCQTDFEAPELLNGQLG